MLIREVARFDVEVFVHPNGRVRVGEVREAPGLRGLEPNERFSPRATRTGMSNPGTTFAHRYDSVVPSTRYSNTGIFVVRRYCVKTVPRSMPDSLLM